ncbi:hypothetical protein PV433_23725 [Paenibacillus sp. GYB004]|uniref:hypothetical protein n=1 Tax=Paenibacillus sp. GYB004 TaxID=2994393 RepID=UPI002F960979
MGNEFYHKLGAAFLFAAAIIYTVERFGQKLAGLAVGEAGFFSNLFVPVFALIGIVIFVFGFPGSRR